MPGFPSPSSGGRPESAPGGSAKSSQPGKAAYGGQSGGQVMISGPEEKALRVLELDNPDDPNDDMQLIQQASQESGLPPDRVQKLQQRADAARNKGMTLKGPTITLQPINPQVEDGLLGMDPMSDVGGQAPGAPGMPGQPNAMGTAGPAAGAPAPKGGSIASGATMSSAGLGGQRYAPSWRPQMSQATKAPLRMTPDVNGAATKPAGYAPAKRPVAPKPLSGGSAGWGRAGARNPKIAAAYAREANVEECASCGGTCKKKAQHRR